jgi:hypothetical protein
MHFAAVFGAPHFQIKKEHNNASLPTKNQPYPFGSPTHFLFNTSRRPR